MPVQDVPAPFIVPASREQKEVEGIERSVAIEQLERFEL